MRPVLAPGAVQFEILSGYNPLPAKPAKTIAATKDADGDCAEVGVPTKRKRLRRASLPQRRW